MNQRHSSVVCSVVMGEEDGRKEGNGKSICRFSYLIKVPIIGSLIFYLLLIREGEAKSEE